MSEVVGVEQRLGSEDAAAHDGLGAVGEQAGVLGTDVEIGGVSPVLEPCQGESNIEEARARPGIDRVV